MTIRKILGSVFIGMFLASASFAADGDPVREGKDITGTLNLTSGSITGDLIPDTDNTYDIGSTTKEWKDLFVDGTANIDVVDIDGNVSIQPATDSTTAVQILDADGGTPVLNVDTTNERLGVGTATPSYPLDVVGIINATTIYEGGVPFVSFDATAVDAVTWSDGANASNVWTFDVSGTDPTMTFGDSLVAVDGAVMNTGPAAVTVFAGTVSASGTTVTFTSTADAILAGYSATNPVLGTTLIADGDTRYIESWTNSTTCEVNTSTTWAGSTAITSSQFPIVEWKKSDGTIGGVVNSAGNVGIGTTGPTDNLTINNADGGTAINIIGADGTEIVGIGECSEGTGTLCLKENSVMRVKLQALGDSYVTNNFGIGTETPKGLLEVKQVTAGVGRVTVVASSTAVVGSSGTQFTNTFKVGNTITANGETHTVATITDDTHLTTDAWTASKSFATYTLVGGSRMTVLGNGNVGINTTLPQSLLDVQGDAGAAGILTLATKELTVVDGDELGRINFNAPLEADGTDAILPGASIWAVAEGTFAADSNATSLVFATGSSEAAAEKMRITAAGLTQFGTASGAGQVNITPASAIDGLYINQDYDDNGIYIDSEATGSSSFALWIDAYKAAYFKQSIVDGFGLVVTRNLGATDDSNPLVMFQNENAANTMPTLFIDHNGTGGATGYGLHVDSENAAGPAVKIEGGTSGILLDLSNDAATPTLAFGDGDTGFYESSDDYMNLAFGGAEKYRLSASQIQSATGYGFSLTQGASSNTTPAFTFFGDTNTGVGHNDASDSDQLSLIAGGVEGLRLIESTGVLQKVQLTTGITATNPGVQGDNPLVSSYNHITTVGTADDAVTLPTADTGVICNVRNDGANQLEVWPASGDDCGSGVDTACTLAAGNAVTYVAIDATTWKIF